MSQMMSQVMGQHMRMEQKLTPQMIQSMDILQLSTQALETRIAEELGKNVALELADEATSETARIGVPSGEAPPQEDAASFSRLDRFSREYDLGFDERGEVRLRRAADSGERDAKMDALANKADRPQGLDDYLLEQWALVDVDAETRRAGQAIINQIEEDGYLRTPLEQVAAEAQPPLSMEAAHRALEAVQRRLEPAGVGARDYRECLLLQVDRLPGDNTIERVLIQNHLEEVARNRYPQIAKATGFCTGEIAAAVEVLRTCLVLHPGYLVAERTAPRVYPDVTIDEDERGKGLVVRLSRGNLPELRIKPEIVEMLKDKSKGKEVRDFLRKQLENAGSLVEAIRYRRWRLLEVAQALITHQAEFFDVGPPGLKALRMSDLAEELKCDPSTISRAVADKYAQTPHGVFPLRYFFTGGTETGDGAGTSWDSIKMRVGEIVKHEDPANPLSDDEIADLLAKEQIPIKRRTVAKYRAQLDIPPARQRRKY